MSDVKMPPRFLAAVLGLLAASCAGTPGVSGGWTALDSATRERVDLETMADALAEHDVVFLGEEHDKTVAHELQFALTRMLYERRGDLVITLEMFERDVDFDLEDYLDGKLGEEEFLERSRPWGNYEEHYRPVVEWARERGIRVVAGNIPRPAARRVAYEGIGAVRKEPWMPAEFEAPRDEYFDLFVEAMGGHRPGRDKRLYNWYSAQCVKDEVMAESIVRWTDGKPTDPIVVHWCGKFHSDRGLGTAARVQRRRPDWSLGIVTTKSGVRRSELTEDDWRDADYVWLVPSK